MFQWQVQFLMVLPVFGRNRPEGKILETVGVFEALKQHGKYETGQVRLTLMLTLTTFRSKQKSIELNLCFRCYCAVLCLLFRAPYFDKLVTWAHCTQSCQVTIILFTLCVIELPSQTMSHGFDLVVVLLPALPPQCVWIQRYCFVSLACPALRQRHHPSHSWQVKFQLQLQTVLKHL